eukprot:jgi/Astpho2/6723/fgenesh1_pg.00102_%23_12_t
MATMAMCLCCSLLATVARTLQFGNFSSAACYTGFCAGLSETYAKTPVPAQLMAKVPPSDTYLFTRTQVPPVTTPTRDPCNFPETYKPRHEAVNLWASLQTKGKQDSAKPPTSHLALGDSRINPFHTSYHSDFSPPFTWQASLAAAQDAPAEGFCISAGADRPLQQQRGQQRLLAVQARIRSPLRNKMLKDVANLRDVYSSAFQRVGEKRLHDMIQHMTERLAGKIGNANNNAFMLRKLFKMYDTANTGQIEIEDFRAMSESFGMQLDDDSLLALFSWYDPQATGSIDYQQLMKQLLHSDYYALYLGTVDNTQNTLEATAVASLGSSLRSRIRPQAERLQKVLSQYDDGTGSVSERALLASCAACNVLLSEKEKDYVLSTLDPSGTHHLPAAEFCSTFCS